VRLRAQRQLQFPFSAETTPEVVFALSYARFVPSPVAHSLAGLAIARVAHSHQWISGRWLGIGLVLLAANAADLDFLPGLLSGFGIQANYTYVDSNVTNPFATAGSNIPTQVPLEKLSKHSYNLVGLYEKGPITARLAWSWRGKYLDTTYGSGANGIPQFQKPYASLDSSISFNLNKHLAISVDAVNITNRMNVTYIGTPSQPLQYTLNDRRFGFSIRATY